MPRSLPASFAIALVSLALGAVAIVSGCAPSPDALAETVPRADAARDAGTVGDAVRTGDPAGGGASPSGEIRRDTGLVLQLPDDFPEDILLPDDYAVVSVTTMGPSRSIVLRSDEPMTALYERFRTVQTGRGWEETVSVLGAEGAMLGFRKDARGVVANFRPDMEGRTLVSLSLQPQVLPAPRQQPPVPPAPR